MKSTGIDLNQIITEVAIALKTDMSIMKLVEKYGEDLVGDALYFIAYSKREETIELEEDFYE